MDLTCPMVRLLPCNDCFAFCCSAWGAKSYQYAGITFSPNGSYAYVTDTGAQYSNFGYNMTAPASMCVLPFHACQACLTPCLARFSDLFFLAIASPSKPTGHSATVSSSRTCLQVSRTVSTVIPTVMSILGSETGCRSGTRQARYWARFSWARPRQTSILRARVGWSSARKPSCTMPHWQLRGMWLRAKCLLHD